jgi:predicted nucleotidyltransferase
MTEFGRLLRALIDQRVDFIIVGGLAATIHGSARSTVDVDVVYSRSPANIERLVAALAPYQPYPRGAPAGLPFRWSADTIRSGLNFTLVSTIGAVDLLGEVTGGGTYEHLLPHAVSVTYENGSCLCVSLPKLIALKRAAGRPKDNEVLAELELLLELQKGSDSD